METMIKTQTNIIKHIYPLSSAKERLSVWIQAKGMWKNKKNKQIKELNKMRKEWDRDLSSLK